MERIERMSSGDQFEAELRAALEASAQLAMQSAAENAVEIDKDIDAHETRGGVVTQRNLIDQFHPFFKDAIEEFEAPSSICGYVTIATCRILHELMTRSGLSQGTTGGDSPTAANIRQLGDALLSQKERLLAEVRRAMQSIRAKRERYMAAHPADFPDAQSKKPYLRAWVANYELSDELRESTMCDPPCHAQSEGPPMYFARHNEYPILGEATHEEKQRIEAEQKRFGGHVDARGVAHYDEDDSPIILEMLPVGRLMSPQEFRQSELEETQAVGASNWIPTAQLAVLAVDLGGHFTAALLGCVEGQKTLAMLNSTHGSYTQYPMPGLILAGISSGPAGTKDQSPSRSLSGPSLQRSLSGEITEAEALLVSMGFPLAQAREALEASHGNANEAVNLLL